jgi:hypothetical protein
MVRQLVAALAALFAAGPALAQVTARPDVMTSAFQPGFVGEADEDRYPLRTLRIGELNLASGRLVVADPFLVRGEETPLDLAIAPGRYPVDIAVADTGKGGHRVALARLLLSQAPPVRWSMAVTAGEDVRTLKGDQVFGFGVDTGTGAFLDAGAARWIGQQPPESADARSDDWQGRGEAQGLELGIPYGFVLVDEAGPGGVAMFSSGWGDGHYASWVGHDAQGRPAQVVTDFAVITAVNIPRR